MNLRLIVATVVVTAFAGLASAQTVANGPYYAVPSWDQSIMCVAGNCPRFVVLSNMSNDAVLDRESGLVWQKAPDTFTANWEGAALHCAGTKTGGKLGWRLPTIDELGTLGDATQGLPPGHPFEGIVPGTDFYWSSTVIAGDFVVGIQFLPFGANVSGVSPAGLSVPQHYLCVRGGHGS
jgi:hypothetical protein